MTEPSPTALWASSSFILPVVPVAKAALRGSLPLSTAASFAATSARAFWGIVAREGLEVRHGHRVGEHRSLQPDPHAPLSCWAGCVPAWRSVCAHTTGGKGEKEGREKSMLQGATPCCKKICEQKYFCLLPTKAICKDGWWSIPSIPSGCSCPDRPPTSSCPEAAFAGAAPHA